MTKEEIETLTNKEAKLIFSYLFRKSTGNDKFKLKLVKPYLGGGKQLCVCFADKKGQFGKDSDYFTLHSPHGEIKIDDGFRGKLTYKKALEAMAGKGQCIFFMMSESGLFTIERRLRTDLPLNILKLEMALEN